MKNVGLVIAIASIAAFGANAAPAGQAQGCGRAPATEELTAPAPRNLAFPSFCDIPPAPKSVPTAATFKTEVVGVRVAGRDLDQQSSPGTWSLSGTDAFAAGAERASEPPPPMSSTAAGETEAFVKQSQAATSPPAKPRHRHH